MTFPKEFKEAISHLPSIEKDKLIFRLLKKDLALANRLMFELVSDVSVEERRAQVQKRMQRRIRRIKERFYSPGYLHMDMRDLSGLINEHLSITKDKYGEVSLNLMMINGVLEEAGDLVLPFPEAKSRKFSVYIIARAFKILVLMTKIHEDLWMELEPLVVKMGQLIGKYPYLMDKAIYHGLDVNWLIRFEIPDDIAQIHKELRANGYLK